MSHISDPYNKNDSSNAPTFDEEDFSIPDDEEVIIGKKNDYKSTLPSSISSSQSSSDYEDFDLQSDYESPVVQTFRKSGIALKDFLRYYDAFLIVQEYSKDNRFATMAASMTATDIGTLKYSKSFEKQVPTLDYAINFIKNNTFSKINLSETSLSVPFSFSDKQYYFHICRTDKLRSVITEKMIHEFTYVDPKKTYTLYSMLSLLKNSPSNRQKKVFMNHTCVDDGKKHQIIGEFIEVPEFMSFVEQYNFATIQSMANEIMLSLGVSNYVPDAKPGFKGSKGFDNTLVTQFLNSSVKFSYNGRESRGKVFQMCSLIIKVNKDINDFSFIKAFQNHLYNGTIFNDYFMRDNDILAKNSGVYTRAQPVSLKHEKCAHQFIKQGITKDDAFNYYGFGLRKNGKEWDINLGVKTMIYIISRVTPHIKLYNDIVPGPFECLTYNHKTGEYEMVVHNVIVADITDYLRNPFPKGYIFSDVCISQPDHNKYKRTTLIHNKLCYNLGLSDQFGIFKMFRTYYQFSSEPVAYGRFDEIFISTASLFPNGKYVKPIAKAPWNFGGDYKSIKKGDFSYDNIMKFASVNEPLDITYDHARSNFYTSQSVLLVSIENKKYEIAGESYLSLVQKITQENLTYVEIEGHKFARAMNLSFWKKHEVDDDDVYSF